MQLAQPSPGDFCCHPFPAPIPGLTWAPLIHEEGAGGGRGEPSELAAAIPAEGGRRAAVVTLAAYVGGLQVTGAPTSLPIAPWH